MCVCMYIYIVVSVRLSIGQYVCKVFTIMYLVLHIFIYKIIIRIRVCTYVYICACNRCTCDTY